MRAPNNKPTEKTEQRLAEEERLLNSKPIKMDIGSILENLFEDEKVQEEILAEASKRLDTEESINNVKYILSEFFNSFLVLGYGVDGERIIIKKCDSDKDDDSLIEILRHVFMKTIQGN